MTAYGRMYCWSLVLFLVLKNKQKFSGNIDNKELMVFNLLENI